MKLLRELITSQTKLYYVTVTTNLYAFANAQTKARRKRESKKHETRNNKQNGLAHSRFIVCVTPKQTKTIA